MAMRNLIHLLLFLFTCTSVIAQVCEPDQYRVTLTTTTVDSCIEGQWAFWGSYEEFVPFVEQQQQREEVIRQPVQDTPSFFSRMGIFFKNLFSRDETEKDLEPAKENVQRTPKPETKTETPDEIPTSTSQATTEMESLDTTPTASTQFTPLVTCTENQMQNDPAHCGACNFSCPLQDGAIAKCILGRCAYLCEDNYIDLDNNATNGCECAPDEFESNDHIEEAFSLGTLEQGKEFSMILRTPATDADYFTFDAQHDPEVPFSLRITAPQHQICLYRGTQIYSCKDERITFEESTGLFSAEGSYAIGLSAREKGSCESTQLTIRNS